MSEAITYADTKCIGIHSEETTGFPWCIDRYTLNWIKYYASAVGKGLFFWVFIKFHRRYTRIAVQAHIVIKTICCIQTSKNHSPQNRNHFYAISPLSRCSSPFHCASRWMSLTSPGLIKLVTIFKIKASQIFAIAIFQWTEMSLCITKRYGVLIVSQS